MLSIGVMICGIVLTFAMKPEVPFLNSRRSRNACAGRDALDASLPVADER
ncbi:hypothetical protein V4C53_05230 [Paraburkholderia azotifigens]